MGEWESQGPAGSSGASTEHTELQESQLENPSFKYIKDSRLLGTHGNLKFT